MEPRSVIFAPIMGTRREGGAATTVTNGRRFWYDGRIPNAPVEFKKGARMTGEEQWRALVAAARGAAPFAYCPYSGFRVGAAVLGDDGRVFAGCNVENASYGLAICAERNAVFHAVAAGARRIVAMAIYTPTDRPTAPCGACRQVIHECGPETVIRAVCDGEAVQEWNVRELLPHAFGPENLADGEGAE